MSGRVLVVDDERNMVRTFRDIMEFRGWETAGAFSGEEALKRLEEHSYDVILMDVRMSGMNGVETLVAMKEAHPGVRVILMTAYTATELLEEARREGAIAILPKPIQIPDLVEHLEEAVRERRSILVVDDDPDFLSTLGSILREGGYEAVEAGGLDEAVEYLRRRRPGVVVLDLRLERIDPRDSITTIREVSPAVTIILYSGHPAQLRETAAALPSRWVHAVLPKPFEPDRLLGLLEGVLDG